MKAAERQFDVLVLGAGAAGLMCAMQAGKRGKSVLVLDHNERAGEKILISGGGRCNFTNRSVSAENYLSQNPHFAKSALARYSPKDFLTMMEQHGISYHEREHGQLFCNESARQIVRMLLDECRNSGVQMMLGTGIRHVLADSVGSARFQIHTSRGSFAARSVVVATGGLSIPTLGATPFGLKLAEQFGLSIVPPRPGLVPLTFSQADARIWGELSGIAIDVRAECSGIQFHENMLFTHRGLSGPAILQASSYWQPGGSISVDLLPGVDIGAVLQKEHGTRKLLTTVLEAFLPARFVEKWVKRTGEPRPMNTYSVQHIKEIEAHLHEWKITPHGTEGYKKAEVTVGGVDTKELSSKTMECRNVPGLYYIGEVVDVTGWLGGYNFQWAWASGWVAGNSV